MNLLNPCLVFGVLPIFFTAVGGAAEPGAKAEPAVNRAAEKSGGLKPTLANVAYGSHTNQVLDFYQATIVKKEQPFLQRCNQPT